MKYLNKDVFSINLAGVSACLLFSIHMRQGDSVRTIAEP